jgi:PPOX class probable F420-dependent enzyme
MSYFDTISSHRAVLLSTFRRDGSPVATPVWIVVDDASAFIVSRGRGKERRIQANPAVQVTPARGPRANKSAGAPLTARATILGGWDNFPYGAVHPVLGRAFRRKYGMLARLAPVATRLTRWRYVLIRLDPPA